MRLATRGTSSALPMGCLLKGLVVLDVVEGTAMAGLAHMGTFLSRRPKRFGSLEEAIDWSSQIGGGPRKLRAARISLPSQLIRIHGEEGGWRWRTVLERTGPHWDGWYRGMSRAFLSAPLPKLLILAGRDRLDKELTIGHMSGKFSLVLMPHCGHMIHEDAPAEVGRRIWAWQERMLGSIPPPSSS